MALSPGLCLVTGATGFVGSAVAAALISSGQTVRALVRPESDRRNLAQLGLETVEGALEDAASLARALHGCRYLFHVAADYRLWVPDPAAMMRTNVEGTKNAMLAALDAGIERVVYTSSVAALGIVADGAADEETPSRFEDMIGPYKQSKFLAEKAVRALVAERGLPAVIVNPSTPVGPRDVKPTPSGRLILKAARGQLPGFVDTGLNLVHVDDVAAGHLAAAQTGRIGERYILGGENMPLRAILAEVATQRGLRPPSFEVPRPLAYGAAVASETWARFTGREPFITRNGVRMAKKKMYFTSAKAIRELGYRARPAREGIADALRWFAANGYLS